MPALILRKFIGEKMNRIITVFVGITLFSIIFNACIPDRMPSAPEEIERPVFAQIEYWRY